MSPSRIAFGSCNDQDRQNNFWDIIRNRKPTAFIWGGDSIYADYGEPLDWSTFPPSGGNWVCADEKRLRRLYDFQRQIPGYKALVESNVTVFGTFDDHDYGCDNADSRYEYRVESAQAFVDFLGVSHDSAMAYRARMGYGVYGVKLFDFDRPVGYQVVPEEEAGLEQESEHSSFEYSTAYSSNKTVAVFVLDVRSNKTPWKSSSSGTAAGASSRLDYDGDFLGEDQWQWFESAISRSKASVNVVVNGLQVHANLFPDGNVAESWNKYPRAQQRLFDALLSASSAPILISGDVHMTQFMRKDCYKEDSNSNDEARGVVRPLVEMTTSGMTHSWGTTQSPPIGDHPEWKPSLLQRYQSFASGSFMTMLNHVCPWTDVMKSSDDVPLLGVDRDGGGGYESGGAEGAKIGNQFSLEKNFGELEFDWDSRSVTMRSMGEDGTTPLLSAKFTMDQLSGKSPMPGSYLSTKDYHAVQPHLKTNLQQGEWTCINHRGRVNDMEYMLGHLMTGIVMLVVIPFPILLPVCTLLNMIRARFPRNAIRTLKRSASSHIESQPIKQR